MRRIWWLAAIFILPAWQGCTSVGLGAGQLIEPGAGEQAVAFSWTSQDGGMSGTMTAALPDAMFQGRFFQITQQTRYEALSPLWSHWSRGWYDWPYWGGPLPPNYPTPQFITHYTGKVVATLSSSTDQRMRCRFHLVQPSRGMSGGGEGQCQLTGGRVVRAIFQGN
jgi:hypothetical protein